MKTVSSVLLVFLLCVNFLAISSVAAQPSEKLPVIIKFNGKTDTALIRAYGGDIKYEYTIISAIACSLPEQAIDALRRNPNIEQIEPDGKVYAIGETLDWGVDRIDAELVHPYNTGAGIKVAVIDTGIDYTHPDLSTNYKGGYDFVNDDNDPLDDNGHGTHCAGTIAAIDNEIGVIGVAPEAHLYALKILDSTGGGSESDLIAAIQWATNPENAIQIISMSLGADGASTSLEAACNNAEAAGVVLVAAAGNDYRGNKRVEWDTVDYPGRFDSVIAVAATDQDNIKASFSSTGPDVEIAAPGVDILSTYPGGYATGSGTSMACPHVAGVAALIFASGVESASEVRTILQATADDLGTAGQDYWYGFGLVDADEAAPEPTEDTIPPTISELTPADGSITNDATPVISAKVVDSSGIDETTIVMKIDDVKIIHTFVDSVVSYTPSTLSEGSHTVALTVSDIVDNVATRSWSFTVDTISPIQVTGLTVTAASSSQLDLTWDTVSDAVKYKVYRNGGFIATTTTNSFSDTGLLSSTIYSYTVTAVDLAGNEGPHSEQKQGTTLEAPATPKLFASIEVTLSTRSAGPNIFYSATATVKVTEDQEGQLPLAGATVYGHWESATSDSDMGTTDTNGIITLSSDSVKNPSSGTTFTFVIDDVVLTGYNYEIPEPKTSDSITISP